MAQPREPAAAVSWLRIGGVPVVLPWSSLIGVLLIAWLFAPSFGGAQRGSGSAFLVAGVFALLVYASILAHELAHAAAARHFGYPVHRIELHLLGGYTTYERQQSSPGRELTIALAGPFTTLAVAVVAYAAARGLTTAAPDLVVLGQLLSRLASVSLFIGLYNLLPGLPLDGGAIVKCLVWKVTGDESRGTSAGGWTGLVVAAVVFALPFLFALSDGYAPDPASVVIAAVFAAWLGQGAWSAVQRGRIERRLDGLTVANLVRPVVVVPGDLPLAEAVRRSGTVARLLVVDGSGRPLATVQDAAVQAVPAERRPWVTVAAVARALESPVALPSSLAGHPLLQALTDNPATDHLVTGPEGALTGVLATADVERALAT